MRRAHAWFWFGALVTFVGCVAEAQSPHSERSIAIHKTRATPKPVPPIAPVPPVVALPPVTPPLHVTPPVVATLPPSAIVPPDSEGRCYACVGLLAPFILALEHSHGHDSTKDLPTSLVSPGSPLPPLWPTGPGLHPGMPLTPPPGIPGYPQLPTLPFDSLPLVPSGPGTPIGPTGPADSTGRPGAPGKPTPPPVTATPEPATLVMLMTGFVLLAGIAWREKSSVHA